MKKSFAKGKRFRRWLIAAALLLLAVAGWQIVADHFRPEEKVLRSKVRQALTNVFPHQAREVQAQFGLFPFLGNARDANTGEAQCSRVVLIHGLDDPGSVWRNLAPALAQSGYEVWYLHYPNDQPISDSAKLLAERLQEFRSRGTDGIAIVAHSMGGLVVREALTNPIIGYPRQVEEGKAPRIYQLIMVGTPNHGSEMARFRIFTEIRDQWMALVQGRGHWLRWIFDGAGEAKIDLLPESEFLTQLNARPHPADVDMLVIAGLASPWKRSDIESLRQDADRLSRPPPNKAPNQWEQALLSVTDGLGDGLVTVESTRLVDVPHLTVNGTHMGMIRNIQVDSPRVPPAIPVILERLALCARAT